MVVRLPHENCGFAQKIERFIIAYQRLCLGKWPDKNFKLFKMSEERENRLCFGISFRVTWIIQRIRKTTLKNRKRKEIGLQIKQNASTESAFSLAIHRCHLTEPQQSDKKNVLVAFSRFTLLSKSPSARWMTSTAGRVFEYRKL